MNDSVDSTLARMVARGGEPFHETTTDAGPMAMLRRVLGLPPRTHYYERLDGSRVFLTKEEASKIAPIELEMFSKNTAVRLMQGRKARSAG